MFELPYYLALVAGCLRYGLAPKSLARANWALDHGEIGIGSKYATQRAFDQSLFPATEHLLSDQTAAEKGAAIRAFAAVHGYPVILKPDNGAVGKGLMRVHADVVDDAAGRLSCDYMLQAYCPAPMEFGVFWRRERGRGYISGINRKHFPTVIGDGVRTLGALADAHPRRTGHWDLFLCEHDCARVPAQDEVVRLSFVGSHTMGCKFTDDTHLATPELHAALERFLSSQPGYNFGRLDLRCESEAALQAGSFTVIEANGVASLPTHMFDPRHTLGRAWSIFVEHGLALVRIAAEHRHVAMERASWREIGRRVAASRARLEAAHAGALARGQRHQEEL